MTDPKGPIGRIVEKLARGKNVVWNGIDYVVAPLGTLLATPVYVKCLGIEQFGVLMVLNSLIGFSATANFGLGDTTIRYVSQYCGTDRRHTRQIIQTVALMSLLLGLVLCGLVLLAAPLILSIFKLSSFSYALPGLQASAALIVLKFVESVYAASLKGFSRYDLASPASSLSKVLGIGMAILLVLRGYDIAAVLWASVAATFASIMAQAITCSLLAGNVAPFFYRSVFGELWHYSIWTWLQKVAGVIYANVDRLILSAVLGPKAMGLYGICLQLSQQIHTSLAALSHSFFPRISALQADATEGADERRRSAYLQACRLLTVCAVTVSGLVAVFSYQILDLWVGAAIAEQGHLILSFLAISYGWFASNSIISYYTLNGLGKARLQAFFSAMSSVLIVLSSAVLIPLFGLLGAALIRLPDMLFRTGVRMYVGTRVVGQIRRHVPLDFMRLSVVAIGFWWAVKELLQWKYGLNFLKDPIALSLMAVSTPLLPVFLNGLERLFLESEGPLAIFKRLSNWMVGNLFIKQAELENPLVVLLRFLAIPVVQLGVKLRLKPNIITLASIGAGVASGIALLLKWPQLFLLFWILSVVLDYADGTLARKTNAESFAGYLLDQIGDRLKLTFVLAAWMWLQSNLTDYALGFAALGFVLAIDVVSHIFVAVRERPLVLRWPWRPIYNVLFVFNMHSFLFLGFGIYLASSTGRFVLAWFGSIALLELAVQLYRRGGRSGFQLNPRIVKGIRSDESTKIGDQV